MTGCDRNSFWVATDGDEEAGAAIEALMAGAKVTSKAGRKKGRLAASGGRPPSAAGAAGSSAAAAAADATTPKTTPALTAGVPASASLRHGLAT